MRVADVLSALINSDTAQDVATRLREPEGHCGQITCARVVPLLNQAREEGHVVRSTPDRAGEPSPLARWSFA